MTKDKFKSWSLSFTMHVLTLLTVFWFIFMVYSGILIWYTIYKTGEFSFLDTYISRICDCFMAGVITGLITRTIGNVFEFNDGSFMGVSHKRPDEAEECLEGVYTKEEPGEMGGIDGIINECKETYVSTEEIEDVDDEPIEKETKKKKPWFMKRV